MFVLCFYPVGSYYIFKRLTLVGAVRSSEEVLGVLDREEEAASLVSVVEAASCSL